MDKIICVGKNYLDHAKELGDAVPEHPVFFLKPPSSLIAAKSSFKSDQSLEVVLPRARGDVHYECEIVCQLNEKGGIEALTLGLDLTLRDLQNDLKKKGHPWEVAKVFRNAAVIGPWVRFQEFPNFMEEKFEFLLEGVVKQSARGSEMRYSPEWCIRSAQFHFPICKGDLLFTGTPAGVGPLQVGQRATLRWGSYLEFSVLFS